eukprot:m.149671 g.149671  ORF g.149671 m.149671 type:complete len:549 (+) comp15070_c0_seq1:1039-2685(+)
MAAVHTPWTLSSWAAARCWVMPSSSPSARAILASSKWARHRTSYMVLSTAARPVTRFSSGRLTWGGAAGACSSGSRLVQSRAAVSWTAAPSRSWTAWTRVAPSRSAAMRRASVAARERAAPILRSWISTARPSARTRAAGQRPACSTCLALAAASSSSPNARAMRPCSTRACRACWRMGASRDSSQVCALRSLLLPTPGTASSTVRASERRARAVSGSLVLTALLASWRCTWACSTGGSFHLTSKSGRRPKASCRRATASWVSAVYVLTSLCSASMRARASESRPSSVRHLTAARVSCTRQTKSGSSTSARVVAMRSRAGSAPSHCLSSINGRTAAHSTTLMLYSTWALRSSIASSTAFSRVAITPAYTCVGSCACGGLAAPARCTPTGRELVDSEGPSTALGVREGRLVRDVLAPIRCALCCCCACWSWVWARHRRAREWRRLLTGFQRRKLSTSSPTGAWQPLSTQISASTTKGSEELRMLSVDMLAWALAAKRALAAAEMAVESLRARSTSSKRAASFAIISFDFTVNFLQIQKSSLQRESHARR